MARARLLKPQFFKNETLAELPPETRLLYAGLWGIADREGRLEDRPVRIRAEVFPYETYDVEAMLAELAARGFIVRYRVAGAKYIEIPTFLKHQCPHIREAQSEIPPAQCENEASTVQESDEHSSSPAVSDPVPVPVPKSESETGSVSVPKSVAKSETVSSAARRKTLLAIARETLDNIGDSHTFNQFDDCFRYLARGKVTGLSKDEIQDAHLKAMNGKPNQRAAW